MIDATYRLRAHASARWPPPPRPETKCHPSTSSLSHSAWDGIVVETEDVAIFITTTITIFTSSSDRPIFPSLCSPPPWNRTLLRQGVVAPPPIPKIQALSAAGRASESEAGPMHCLLKLPIARPPPIHSPPGAAPGGGGRETSAPYRDSRETKKAIADRGPSPSVSILQQQPPHSHCDGDDPRALQRQEGQMVFFFFFSAHQMDWGFRFSNAESTSQMSTSPSDIKRSVPTIQSTVPPPPPRRPSTNPHSVHHSLPIHDPRPPSCLPAFPPRIANERTKTCRF